LFYISQIDLHPINTTSVNVHDIATIQAGGLKYSAFLPFAELASKRQPCDKGPKTALIRAVLSWATPPSTTNPYDVPFWGGHAETHILIPPGNPVAGNAPLIETIGSMAIAAIDNSTGLATGPAVAVGFTANDSPFGGQIWLTGHIANPSDFVGGAGAQMKYRIMISTDGGANYFPMNTTFTIWTTDLVGGIWQSQVPRTQTPDADGWYQYFEDITGPSMRFVAQNSLGYWPSAGDGTAHIYMEAKNSLGNPLGVTPTKLIQLDNTAPTCAISITSGGGSCGDFKVGVTTIDGIYSVTDNEHFGSARLILEPGNIPITPVPTTTTATSQSGTWHLNTGGLSPCGYVVRLEGYDRTIVNSGWVGWGTPIATGFCLK
jgi:hypothetical protein